MIIAAFACFLLFTTVQSAQQNCQTIIIQRCNTTSDFDCVEQICVSVADGSSSLHGAPVLVSVSGFTGSNINGMRHLTKTVNASTRIDGCAANTGSSTTLFRSGSALRVVWSCKTSDGNQAEIVEEWGAGPNGSLEWNTSIASSNVSFWTSSISHNYAIGINSSAQHRGWVPAAREKAYPSSGFSPLDAWSLDVGPPGTVLPLGSEGGSAVTIMGMFAVLFDDEDAAVSVIHDPSAQPYSASLEICHDDYPGKTGNDDDPGNTGNSTWFQAGSYDALWGVCDSCVHKPNASVVSYGTTQSWQMCQAACVAYTPKPNANPNTNPNPNPNRCSIYAWSAKSGGCYFRLDGVWGGEGTRTRSCGGQRMSGCLLGAVSGCGTNPGGDSNTNLKP